MFNVGTYSHYRGSVLSPFHSGPISPTKHHVTLTGAVLLPDGGVKVHAYLDAGTPEAPLHLVDAVILGADKAVIEHWDAKALSALPKTAFTNDYAYNKFGPGPYGIRAPMGAKATIMLPSTAGGVLPPDGASLRFTDVDGQTFSSTLHAAR